MKELMEKIIPYCSEDFITIPLWEEGDFRWQMNLWKIIKLNNYKDFNKDTFEKIDKKLEEIMGSVTSTHQGFGIYFERDINFSDNYIKYDFEIIQTCEDITDKGFILNYNMEDYMRIAVELLKKLSETEWA